LALDGSSRLPWLSWLVLALICFYGVAQAHDYFALLRARVAMTDRLQQQGVPRTQIMAGTEYDFWTSFQTAGYINDPRIRYPEGLGFRRAAPPGFETLYLGWQFTPRCVRISLWPVTPSGLEGRGHSADLLYLLAATLPAQPGGSARAGGTRFNN